MIDPAAAEAQAEWARLLAGSLADAGVRDVVVCPGSRSTPFVLALVRESRLVCRDVVDERSAAFFALGQARRSGRPSLVVCTSGTAGANLFPAVVEAALAHVPLLVLTADRPPELVGCGANQTIDQLHLFGRHVRAFFELGTPSAESAALRALRRTAAQAVFASGWPEPGPVHLNARARKPLEPPAGVDAALVRRVDLLLAGPIAAPSMPRRLPDTAVVEELVAACRRARRGLLVAGPATRPADRSRVFAVAARTGFPLLADPASGLRFRGEGVEPPVLDAFALLLANAGFRRFLAPDLVIQVGGAPTAAGWETLIGGGEPREHWVLSTDGWPDPASTATRLVAADVDEVLEDLVLALGEGVPDPDAAAWRAGLEEAERRAWHAVEAQLHAFGDALSEGAVAREAVAALPAGGLLALGNSLPIREADRWCPGELGELVVVSQRGASGIDGVVSGALGAASLDDRPGALVVGDLSTLHDLGGLAAARHVTVPFAVVVVDNHGGRLFEQLPLAAHPQAEGLLEHWTTPQSIDFAAAAATFGLPYARAVTRSELAAALAVALGREGVSVIHAVVPPSGAANAAHRLRARVDAAIADLVTAPR